MTSFPQTHRPDPAQAAAPSLWLPLAAIWLLMLVTFSLPGREGPSSVGGLDQIALAKLACRVVLLVGFAIWFTTQWAHPKRPAVAWCFLPFALYVCWALTSALWSPLPAISLGQASGLLVLVMLAAAVAMSGGTPQRASAILCHLSSALFLISLVLLMVRSVNVELSGLYRGDSHEEGAMGLFHPTSAGATASLGLLVLVGSRLLWDWEWTRRLLVPGLVVHSAVLLLAASRMALLVTVAVLVVMVCALLDRRRLAALVLTTSLAGAAYLAIDPGFDLAENVAPTAVGYLTRGESSELLLTLTGRTPLWEAVWKSFLEAPLRGQGYFVTSRTGAIGVWSEEANTTAHNVMLQVLVSTGVVGGAIFLWALFRPLRLARPGLAGGQERRALALLCAFVGAWFFGWGLLCESFMGPIQPESVVFFTALGLAAGNWQFAGGERAAA